MFTCLATGHVGTTSLLNTEGPSRIGPGPCAPAQIWAALEAFLPHSASCSGFFLVSREGSPVEQGSVAITA